MLHAVIPHEVGYPCDAKNNDDRPFKISRPHSRLKRKMQYKTYGRKNQENRRKKTDRVIYPFRVSRISGPQRRRADSQRVTEMKIAEQRRVACWHEDGDHTCETDNTAENLDRRHALVMKKRGKNDQ